MREYRLPSGEIVPPNLQEQIAQDVRAFDAAQTPEARSAGQLRKIANELPRLRATLGGGDDERSMVGRIAVAMEIQVLLDLGYPPDKIKESRYARSLAFRYGLGFAAVVDDPYRKD